MKRHIMTSPDDLDLFASDQVNLTREFDADRTNHELFMISVVAALLNVSHSVAGSAPYEFWQRFAYEAHQRTKTSDKVQDHAIARMAWATVQMIQVCTAESRNVMVKSPEARERHKLIFGKEPDISED